MFLQRENKELFEETISATCHSLYTIATLLWPVMPKKMEELLFCIGYSLDLNKDYEEELRKNVWNKKFKLRKPDKPLFVRPEKREDKMEKKQGERKENKEETKEKGELENIKIDDFVKVHLVVGEILSCDEVEGSNKLYKLSVDLGEYGKRQVLAGVKKYFKLEDLIGKQGIYVANLAPRKILGLESQGMMLFSKDDKGMHIVTVGTPSKNGTRLS